MKSPTRFAELLSQAIKRIAVTDNKKIHIIQDELGYALGREAGGSAIEYWRKGHVPGQDEDIEALTGLLVARGGLTQQAEVVQFLTAAGLPQSTEVAFELTSSLPPEKSDPFSPPQPAQILPTLAEHPPFIAGPPISHPYYFFGRERELKRLFNLFKRRPLQNAAIIGPRRSGKTSLLLYLKTICTAASSELRPQQYNNWLPKPYRYRWVLVNFQDPRLSTQVGLLHYLLTALAMPIPNEITLDSFMTVVSQHLQTPTLILLDEIGVALKRHSELDDFFWEGLRALATHQTNGNLGFVVAAQEPPNELAQHHNLGSPFFNIFGYTARLKPFLPTEAQDLIDSSPLPFSETDSAWIIEHSHCWPILLQLMCRERLLCLEEGEIDNAWQQEGLQQIEPYQYLYASKSSKI